MSTSAFLIVVYYTLKNCFAVLIILPSSHGILFSFVWLFYFYIWHLSVLVIQTFAAFSVVLTVLIQYLS